MAVYGASKAFVLSFSEALWAENRSRGVRVLALCPGATETAFFDVVAAPEAAVGKRMAPQVVVDEALLALDRGRSSHVAGRPNRLLAWLPRLLPRQTVLGIVEGMLKPKAA
jgi:short-subunit dehydrogenase